MAKLLPVILLFAGLAAGLGGGMVLRPTAPTETGQEDCAGTHGESDCAKESVAQEGDVIAKDNVEYAKLSKQFVVPDVRDGKVAALVVMSLSIEVAAGSAEAVYEKEPKLRDSLLRVMFLHANSGGFEGQFTSRQSMKDLRGSLRESAQDVLGDIVSDVLVTDILRQDIKS